MTTTIPTAACPSWCRNHPAHEPEGTHCSATWRSHGLSVSFGVGPEHAVEVWVDHGFENLSLTEEQAAELGMQLVRVASKLRQERLDQR